MLTNDQLLQKRLVTDPIADETVRAIIDRGNTEEVAQLFNSLTENINLPKDNLPKEAIDYFETTKKLPDFIDYEKIKVAQKVFGLYGPEISMVLLCKSLPQCYACANGAKVLYGTGRFVEHDGNYDLLTRRLMETAQFVINVLAPNSFSDTGSAIITTQKIRLIHASIRHFINYSGRWDAQLYGEPINQEDMAGTLMSFSALVIEGLEKLGIELSEEQEEGYFHLWRVVGYIIGLDEDLIPENYKEGLTLGYAIFNQQMKPSMEGEALTASAIGFMEHVTPGNIFDSLSESLVHYLIGDKVAKVVGVKEPTNFFAEKFPQLMSVFFDKYDQFEDRFVGLNRLTAKFNRALLQGMLNYFNKGKSVYFDIPPSLQQDWNLKENWNTTWNLNIGHKRRIQFQKRT